MRRTDTVLVVVVGALATFVGLQVVRRPPRPSAGPTHDQVSDAAQSAASTRPAQPKDAPRDKRRDMATSTVQSSAAAPARNLDAIRARIAATTGTYMPDMIADLNGELVRWPDRREKGLRIWVQSITGVHDWDLRYAQMARDAFDDWGQGHDGLPLRFDFVLDSATSDVQIVWTERFAPELGRRVGLTKRTNDQNGWLVAAQITVAIHDSTGRTIPPENLAGIVRHESGHALGLGHSRDPRTKMYPTEVVSDITASDRATLRLLYQLPPGAVR